MKFSTINARSEGVFEWSKEGSAKRPFKIFQRPTLPLSLICISSRLAG